MTHDLLLAAYGGCIAAFIIISLIFVRYWVNQRERLFGFFGAAFFFFALGFAIRVSTGIDEHRPYVFIPRLIGFLLIIAAIFDKNRRARAAESDGAASDG